MSEVVVWILIALVVGFLGGWLLEYYLDLRYWEIRARRRGLFFAPEEAGDSSAQPSETFPPKLSGSDPSGQALQNLQDLLKKQEAEMQELRAEQKKQQARYAELEQRHRQYMITHPDDLTAIRGIGRIYEWRLRDAGISSFDQLASTTTERLIEIMELPEWRKFDPESWIEQAKVLAQRGE